MPKTSDARRHWDMPKTSDARRHWRLLPHWPEGDRGLWFDGVQPCHDLDVPSHGQRLTPASLASIERFYGRYLTFLDQIDELDETATPDARVTPSRLAKYLRHLQELGYAAQTRKLAISGLRSALRIMIPDADTAWFWRPSGVPLHAWLSGPRKTFDVPRSAELYQWGLDLMRDAEHPTSRRGLAVFRDGLMIALLAARPVRRRTLANLRIGQHLIPHDGGWRLVLAPGDMKNRRALEVDLPQTLRPWIDRYLSEIRPRLLNGNESDALWIATHGRPMALTAVGLMIRARAKRRFGHEFGPHRFRHALGTTMPAADPTSPGLAATILAVGAGMVEAHYNRAGNHVAAAGLHDALEAERDALAALAERLFRERRDHDGWTV